MNEQDRKYETKISLDENTVKFHYFLNTDFTEKFEKNKIIFPISKFIAVSNNSASELQQKMAYNIGLCGGIINPTYADYKAKSAYGILIVEPKVSIYNKPVGISIIDIINIDEKPSLYVEILCSTQPNYSRVGTVIMKQLFKLSSINNFEYITLHSREDAVPFYIKMGFTLKKSVKSLLLDEDSDDETDDGLIPMRIKVNQINIMNPADKKKFFDNFADKELFFNKLLKMNPFRKKRETIVLRTSNQSKKNPVTIRIPKSSLIPTSRTGVLGGRKNTKRKHRRSNKTRKNKK